VTPSGGDEGYFRQFGRMARPAAVTAPAAATRRPGQVRAVSRPPPKKSAVRPGPQHIPAGRARRPAALPRKWTAVTPVAAGHATAGARSAPLT
jgi:hypothetical protein